MADEQNLEKLIRKALDLGADRAATLAAGAVVVDERVLLKCRVPLCSSYGRNLMCPPNVPGPDETRAVLARYADALVVQRDIGVTQAQVDEALGGVGYAESRARDADGPGAVDVRSAAGVAAGLTGESAPDCENEIVAAQNTFARLMTDLETEAFKVGHRFAAAFAGGDCVLCPVCVGAEGGACRHPFAARPSMEAVGIDVIATARAAGLEIEMPAVDRPCWTGLLLVR